MTFGEMVDALRRFWVVVVLFTVAALVIAAVAATAPETRYEARATLLAQPESELVDFASVEAVRFLLPSLAELVSTNTFRAQVGQQLDPPLPASEVDAKAEFEPGTGIVHVTGTDADPALAQEIAQVSAVLLGDQELSAAVSITVLDPPELPTSEAGPGTGAYLVGGLVLGLLGGALLAIILAVARKSRAESSAGVVRDSPGTQGRGRRGGGGASTPAPTRAPTLVAETTEPGESELDPSWTTLEWSSAASGPQLVETESASAERARPGVGGELEARLAELGLDVLGHIPVKGEDSAGHAARNGSHDFDGAFRQLAERLADATAGHPALAVTSPRAGAGRTTVAANVAWALAGSGRAVMAADGDLENPMLHRFLRVHERPGLVDLADRELDDVRQDTALPGLAVVAGGGASNGSSLTFARAAEKLVRAGDRQLVVIDAPSVLDSSGAAVAAQVGGATVLVLDAADASSVDDLVASASRLDELGVQIVGAVLNRVAPGP